MGKADLSVIAWLILKLVIDACIVIYVIWRFQNK